LLVGLATCSTSVLLVAAGCIKVLRPRPAAGSLRRASSRLMRWPQHRLDGTARAVGAVELLVGTAAILVHGPIAVAVAGFVFVLFVSFVGLTRSARARGVACGCWGSLSDGRAGDGEVNRRVLLAALAAVPLAARIGDTSTRQMPWGVATGVAIVGLVAGVLLATDSMPLALRRIGAAATFGVGPSQDTHQAIATGRGRRASLDRVRGDVNVARVTSAINAESRLAWSRARVMSPADASNRSENFLVAVPGDGVNLRIVVANGRTLMVIGESDTEIVTAGASELTVTAKRRASTSSAA
jgi:hypothetical protein